MAKQYGYEYRKKYYVPTTKPNGTIAGEGGAGNDTGDQSEGFGMPECAGTYADHYEGGGRGKAKAPLRDQEMKTGSYGNEQKVMKQKTPLNTAGTGADDYNKPLKDSEQEPSGPRAGKPGKGLKFSSIAQLRDYSKKMTGSNRGGY